MPPGAGHQHPDEPPPFLGSWGAVYAVVLGWLGLLVIGFHLLTRWAA